MYMHMHVHAAHSRLVSHAAANNYLFSFLYFRLDFANYMHILYILLIQSQAESQQIFKKRFWSTGYICQACACAHDARARCEIATAVNFKCCLRNRWAPRRSRAAPASPRRSPPSASRCPALVWGRSNFAPDEASNLPGRHGASDSSTAGAPHGATAAPATRALVSRPLRSPAPTHSHASRRAFPPRVHAGQQRPFPGRRLLMLPPLPIVG